MTAPRVGALFAGYGGIELALHEVLGAEPAWFSEIEPAPSRILAHHWPDVPNHGDITRIRWSDVEPVDIITGGYPCQPFSAAGNRRGTDDPRHLWPHVVEAISALRPGACIFENVQGHLSLGLDHVLRDLDLLGYDASWHLLSAASVGAPHRRNRIFILAWERDERHVCRRPDRRGGIHRNPGVGRLVSGPPQGHNDRQGDGGAAPDGAPVRREDRRPASRHGAQSCVVQLAAHGSEGVRTDRDAASAPAGEGRSGGHRPSVPGDGGCRSEAAERSGDLDGRYAREGEGVRASYPGREPSRAGCGCPRPAEWLTSGGSSLGGLVGARGGLVRPGRVHGQAPAERADGRGTHLLDDLTLLPTPRTSDTNGAGEHGTGGADLRTVVSLLPTPRATRGGSSTETMYGLGGERSDDDRPQGRVLLPTPRATDGTKGGPNQRGSSGDLMLPSAVTLLPTPTAGAQGKSRRAMTASSENGRRSGGGQSSSLGLDEVSSLMAGVRPAHLPEDADLPPASRAIVASLQADRFGQYAPAIARWEALTRPAPDPTEPTGKGGAHRLSPRFVEWMMGLPAGWVTDVPGVSRNDALKALGNGVVPQQAAAALRWLTATAADLDGGAA